MGPSACRLEALHDTRHAHGHILRGLMAGDAAPPVRSEVEEERVVRGDDREAGDVDGPRLARLVLRLEGTSMVFITAGEWNDRRDCYDRYRATRLEDASWFALRRATGRLDTSSCWGKACASAAPLRDDVQRSHYAIGSSVNGKRTGRRRVRASPATRCLDCERWRPADRTALLLRSGTSRAGRFTRCAPLECPRDRRDESPRRPRDARVDSAACGKPWRSPPRSAKCCGTR